MPGEEISIDDIDDEKYINHYILNADESRLKETIWKSQNAEYIRDQKLKTEAKKKKDKLKQNKTITDYNDSVNDFGAMSGPQS